MTYCVTNNVIKVCWCSLPWFFSRFPNTISFRTIKKNPRRKRLFQQKKKKNLFKFLPVFDLSEFFFSWLLTFFKGYLIAFSNDWAVLWVLSVWCIWLYVIIMLRSCFRVNLHSIVVWISTLYVCSLKRRILRLFQANGSLTLRQL